MRNEVQQAADPTAATPRPDNGEIIGQLRIIKTAATMLGTIADLMRPKYPGVARKLDRIVGELLEVW